MVVEVSRKKGQRKRGGTSINNEVGRTQGKKEGNEGNQHGGASPVDGRMYEWREGDTGG